MFDAQKFSKILQKISDSYGSISEFAEKSEVNRTYISKYINMKLDSPPTPKILEKISNNSNELISYSQLMEICGYINVSLDFDSEQIKQRTEYFFENLDYLQSIGLNKQQLSTLQDIINMDYSSLAYQETLNNFLSTLSIEMSYNVLKFMQDMLLKLKNDASEKSKLANNLKNEVDKLIENSTTTDELHSIKAKYIKETKQFYMCPVYGKISAGVPNWAEECLEGYLPIDPNMFGIINPEECFFLKVDGESMNKEIKNGAYALIRKQDIVSDGEIAAVLVNGFEATLKRFSKQGDFIVLEPSSTDANFKMQIYDKNTTIKILGKMIGKFEINK